MAINPINLSRVSQNLRTNLVARSLQQNQLELFTSQTKIAMGRSFVTPSDDPATAARALDLTQALQRQGQLMRNLWHGDNTLAAADNAITEINTLLNEAAEIASRDVSNLVDSAERQADAELIAAIRQQLQIVGNRQFDGRYLFAGRDTIEIPFLDALGGIAYTGDTGDLVTRINEDLEAIINVPGNVLFGALSSRIASVADLTPTLTTDVRIGDLGGATGQGVQLGRLVFNEIDGAGVVTVDLEAADTIGDVVGLINRAANDAGAAFAAELSDTGITITTGGAAITVGDTSAGVIAAGLGILANVPTTDPIEGADLSPRVTRLTPVAVLARGNGIDLDSGLIITNGDRTDVVDLSTAQTVQDIINRINAAGLFVLARINDSGTGIDVFNQVSGTSLTIGENGGTTAGDLGIRTLGAGTPLANLNDGLGVTVDEGADDLRIVAKDGATIDVNLDGAITIGDVIELVNATALDAGVNLTASLAETGNGIRFVDGTGGAGELSVRSLNLSTAATDLGFPTASSTDQTELIGEDHNPIRTDGILTALLDLERALRADDTRGISQAASRFGPLVNDVTRVHGVLGARSQGMRDKLTQMEDVAATTEIFLSQVQDLDYAEAVTRLQASLMQLQATMQTSSVLLNMSLMDFLR